MEEQLHATKNPPILKKRIPNCAILEIAYNGTDMEVKSIYAPVEREYIFKRDNKE